VASGHQRPQRGDGEVCSAKQHDSQREF
jgi:hypothetical protein